MAKDKKKKDKVEKVLALPDAPREKKARKKDGSGIDSLIKFAEHPLVSELLAVGALAAVGVIAEHRKLGDVEAKSAKAVKTAGKAAATAIGARLLKEFSGGSGPKKKA